MTTICSISPRQARGFTLIELLVSLLIIGILVGFAVPLFTNVGATAKSGKVQMALDAVAVAKAQWALDPTNTGNPPSTVPTTNQIFPYITVQGAPLTSWAPLLAGTTNTSISINALNAAPTSP